MLKIGRSKRRYLSILAVGTLLSSAAANAQQAGSEQSENAESGIKDIVVTAQRRQETVQKSSLSISVLNEQVLAAVTDAKDINTLVPGVQISNGGATLQTYIRGVGDFGSTAFNQSAVSYNADGVYTADTAAVSQQFYDLERVEVLKGPQGTLYGRNASAGSVNLLFRRPHLGKTSGVALAEVGNYSAVRVSGGLNLPLGDVAALRVSGNYSDHDGYLSDDTSDEHQYGARAQVLFDPGGPFSVRLTADFGRRDDRGPGAVVIPRQAGNGKFTGAIDPENNAARLALNPVALTPGVGLPPPPGVNTGLKEDTYLDSKQQNISADINWDLGFANLTVLPAYRHSTMRIGTYLSGSVFINDEETTQKSIETRLAHDAKWGNLIVGLYYLDLDQFTNSLVASSSTQPAPRQRGNLSTKSIAGFGQATVNISQDFRLIAGARYTSEKRSADAFDITNNLPIPGNRTFKNWSWRAGLEYDLAPQSMAYFTASKGFKSGGFNLFASTPTVTNTYEPEVLTSYSAGVRNRFLDNKVQFNIEAFYWDYKDAQQNAVLPTPAGALQFLTFNAASATLYGADADLMVKLTPADTFSAAIAYLNAKFDNFVIQSAFPTAPASNGCILDNTLPGYSVDCSGRRIPRAPRWSGTVAYDHVFTLGDGGEVKAGGSVDFASYRLLGINYVSNEKASAYARFNADVTYSFGDQRYSVTAFIRNITNKEIAVQGSQQSRAPNLIYAQVSPPRTYGLRLNAKF